MDLHGEITSATSVAPPGWAGSVHVAPTPPLASTGLASGQLPAEAAMRWRLRAASLDYLIVYIVYIGVCALLRWRLANLGHAFLLTAGVAVYHFVLESRGGQTIGKARYGLQVVSLDGGPAGPKAVAIRSALRVVDQLPICYVSGLISMVRTGPARRQRIGDVAAETMVIAVDGPAAERGTASWMLPTATLLALLVSILFVYGLTKAGAQPLTSSDKAQFVAGCDRSAAATVIDCECVLTRLEADGYVTLSSLRDMEAQAQLESLNGQTGSARQELIAAGLACRH